jgi:hypothetical protein
MPLIAGWIQRHGIQILNVAVPRASKAPGIHDAEMNILESVLEL